MISDFKCEIFGFYDLKVKILAWIFIDLKKGKKSEKIKKILKNLGFLSKFSHGIYKYNQIQ